MRRISISEGPVTRRTDGVSLRVRLTPRAQDDRIEGVVDGALKVSVSAPPLDNRANDALLRLLAREWRLPQRGLSLIAGGKGRDKIVLIAGDAGVLAAHVGAALAGIAREPT